MTTPGNSTKAVVAALLANAGIAVAKFAGFLITGSASMLAECVHSVADSGNQCLLLLGGKRARRSADEDHPFGYGRERYFWAFVVAMVLFSLGGAFAIFEGITKIQHPHELDSARVAIAILTTAAVLEAFSLRTALVESRRMKGPASWWSFIRHSKNPELPVVLLEDLGAVVGLLIATTAVTASMVTGNAIYDGYGTLAIGLLLTTIAIILAIEMKSLLIGEAATGKMVNTIRAVIEGDPAVKRLIHMRTQHLGPEEVLVGAKINFTDSLTIGDVSIAVNRIESSIRASVPEATLIYLEPDTMTVP
ncbi:MAG: cation diffusion facilitator family transporter [Acidimicrobiia bacterium]|nr:cation diffusion facilitator family transporter [Acidimicrobiia bacterium]